MALDILFPNGQVLGAQVYINPGSGPEEWDGSISITPSPPAPSTSGGTSDYHKISGASNNAATIKNSPGQIYGIEIFNNAAYPIYVKLYDKVTTPVPASDTPIRTIGCQAGIGIYVSIQFGLPLASGIGIAIVKNISDNDNTSILANDCVVDIDYA